ncbi:hypothetical protein, partial [Helcococcus bovis]
MLNIKSILYLILSFVFKIGIIILIYIYKSNINSAIFIVPILFIIIGLINAAFIDIYINFGDLSNSLILHRFDVIIKILSIYSLDIFIG